MTLMKTVNYVPTLHENIFFLFYKYLNTDFTKSSDQRIIVSSALFITVFRSNRSPMVFYIDVYKISQYSQKNL